MRPLVLAGTVPRIFLGIDLRDLVGRAEQSAPKMVRLPNEVSETLYKGCRMLERDLAIAWSPRLSL